MEKIQISVIIPTYNRGKYIENTLNSLLNQSYEGNYEIIVCDNNSTDDTANIIQTLKKNYRDMRIKYIVEKRQGAHYARNAGALAARGELLYYTDDDMIADYHLLYNLAEFMLRHPKVAIATGRVLPKWESRPPLWVKKYCLNGYLSLLDKGKNNQISSKDVGVYSCHEMIRKDIFLKTGGFHIDFIGKELMGDGETGLNQDILNMGDNFSAYVGKAVTYHIISSGRMTQKYLNARFYGQGNADSYTEYRRKAFTRKDIRIRHKNYCKDCIKSWLQIIIQCFQGKATWRFIIATAYYYKARMIYDNRVINDVDFRKLVLRNNWLISD